MDWVNIKDRLPNVGKDDYDSESIIVFVHCDHWEKDKSMVFDWSTDTVRGKKVSRFKWRDRLIIPQWEVTHWMPLPNYPL